MAEGTSTRQALINEAINSLRTSTNEAINSLREDTSRLQEEQGQQKRLLEAILQKLNQMATNSESFSHQHFEVPERSNHTVPSNLEVQLLENHLQARNLKIDFPRFDGTDPRSWVLKAEQFFKYFHIPEHQKLELAFFYMEGKELPWFVWLKDSEPIENWEQFVTALMIRFGPSLFEDPIGAFTKLKQQTTVEDYQSEFEILSNKIKGLTEEFRISTFISGLKEEIKIMVTMFKPSTLSATFGLARLQEEEVKRRGQITQERSSTSNTTYNSCSLNSSNPINATAFSAKSETKAIPSIDNVSKKPTFPIKRLTPLQMQERRDRGLCYNCDEKYHVGHKCSRPQIFLLEGVEELFVDEFEEEVETGTLVLNRGQPPG